MPYLFIPDTSQVFQFWDVAEGIGGPQVSIAGDGSRVDRFVQVVPGQMGLARRLFVGFSVLKTAFKTDGTQVNYIARYLPHGYEDEQHLDPFGRPWLWGRSVERTDALNVSSVSVVSGAPRGKLDRAHVVYTDRTYDVRADNDPAMMFVPAPESPPQPNPFGGSAPDEATLNRYITRRYRHISRTITVPRAIAKWLTEPGDKNYDATGLLAVGPPVMEAMGRSENGIDLEYTHHEVPNNGAIGGNRPEPCVGMETLGRLINTVNKYTFDGIYAPGTLLMLVPDIVEVRNCRGERVFNITHKFRYLPKYDRLGVAKGHNALLRCIPRSNTSDPAEKTWLDYRYVSLNGKAGGQRIYEAKDWSPAFRPEQPVE